MPGCKGGNIGVEFRAIDHSARAGFMSGAAAWRGFGMEQGHGNLISMDRA